MGNQTDPTTIDSGKRMWRAATLGLALTALLTACTTLPAADPADWAESGEGWYTQSYWQDANILQKYTFTANKDDKVAGEASVEVHIQVAANRPQPAVELRFAPPKPLDLSKAEAIEVSLKALDGGVLKPREVYLCDPGFNKLTIASWPEKLDMTPGRGWQRAVIDLTEARVLDKAKPEANGEYDRHDVTTFCLNFVLPEGVVDQRLLIDGFRVCTLPPPAVKREILPDQSHVFTTAAYRVVVGANGYMRSLKAGPTEFLRTPADANAPGGCASYVDNDPAKGVVPLTTVTPVGRRGLVAKGEKASITYAFREEDFDITLQQTFTTAGLLHFIVSPEVVAVLNGPTDQPLRVAKREAGDHISGRLVTSRGAVLVADQHYPGYTRTSGGPLPNNLWSWRFMAYGPGAAKLTLKPIAQPTAPDAVGVEIACANPDFLLPGGQPVHFDIAATSYAVAPVSGKVTFQVRDYATKKVAGERTTPFKLDPGASLKVPTDVPVAEPGPYRATVVIEDNAGRRREVECVFTYAFPDYKPALTRQPDFAQFWRTTLEELAKVPMDAQITPVPEVSTPDCEAFKVSLATLGGRRVHCWYWKPRAAGRYPAVFQVPSSGIYPFKAENVPHAANQCGMWIAIHGLAVDVDTTKPIADPAAANYWTHGIESPTTSMWRTIYASLVRGMDFLCSREEVDPKRIMVTGGSQGGGLTMVLAGLDRRVAFAAPAHSGLARLDWTVLYAPGFWPFGMGAKPANQTTEQFLKTLSYFDAANFTPDIACPIVAEVSLLDTVTASGNQICALARVKPGLLQLICDPWVSHASDARGGQLRGEAVARWMRGENPVVNPVRP